MLDIQNGDQLIISATTYQISAVTHYNAHGFGTSRAFGSLATVACSTKRRGAVVTGYQPAPTNNLTGIYCTPLEIVTADTRQTPITNTPVVLWETFITNGVDFARLEIQESKQ